MKCSLLLQRQLIGDWVPFLRFAIDLIGYYSIHHCLHWIESVDKFEVSVKGIIMDFPSSFLIWILLIWEIIQKSCRNHSIILKYKIPNQHIVGKVSCFYEWNSGQNFWRSPLTIDNTQQNLSAQIVCPSPKVWDFDEKRLHWPVSVVRVRIH